MKWRVPVIALVAVLAVAASAVGYEVLTSSAPSNPCAAFGTNLTASESPTPATAAAASSPPRNVLPAHHVVVDSGVIQVVAAENFWGSLVAQLGGNNTSVVSIVTDPNTDPHEYEANSTTAIEIDEAQFVIVNGVGYDDWALQLIAAGGNPNQIVLNVGDLNGVSVTGGIVTGNPHMWYNPVYVNRTVAAMYSDLVAIEPSATSYFSANYAALNVSLGELYERANIIRGQFAGTPVASTESIFVYLANYTDLDLVSPPAFMEAIAEGNDPPAQSVALFQCQLESGKIAVLVYNQQTVTPITTTMKSVAAANNVTILGVTETIQPPGVTFQTWMESEYLQLQNDLNAKALGQ